MKKSCELCSVFRHPECGVYNRIPPVGFAEKCKHYDPKEPELEPENGTCAGCPKNDDGYCLRYDHPEYRYNFVKVKDGDICQL